MSSHSYDSSPSHTFRNLAAVVIIVAIAIVGYAWLRGSAPSIAADTPAAIGADKMVSFHVESAAGVAAVEAHYEQNGKTIPIGRQTFAPRRWFTTGDSPIVVHFDVQAGKASHPELQNGSAELIVTAESANLRGARATLRRNVQIQTTPPAVYSLSAQQYLRQGGSEMVIYHVSKTASESGVEMAGTFFRGYPLPDSAPGTMFALFAFPYNAPDNAVPHLVARDAAGNEATASFPVQITLQQFRHRPMTITPAFVERVVMPIIAEMHLTDYGDPVKNFLEVNRDLRHTETQQLLDAAKLTQPHFFWQGAFLQLPNSQVEARFADRRTYMFDGKAIDEESHLGYDLASVEHSPVEAANAGRVVWAKYFGIYGNCILIDHGYGLMSLYGHLNDFQVKAGQMVTKGQLIAHSDSTGLAGGDHLHFSMLIDGVQVNPLQWWDGHWIKNRIEDKIAQFSHPPAASGAAQFPPAQN